jgi:hypothetical protein
MNAAVANSLLGGKAASVFITTMQTKENIWEG